jgi:hypothetical protein
MAYFLKLAPIGLVLAGFVCGLCSAYFWWRSSREPFEPTTVSIITSGTPVITDRDIQGYLSRVSRLNSRAAQFGAIAVTLTTAAGLVPLLPQQWH